MELLVDPVRLLSALSLCLDFSARGVDKHHQRVALTALTLASELSLKDDLKSFLFAAAVIHDIGVRTWGEKARLHAFEVEDPWEHCRRGCELLGRVGFLVPVAQTVLSHHDRWAGGNPSGLSGNRIPLPARILHLADRVDVLVEDGRYVLDQRERIMERIAALGGEAFDPELIRVFREVARRESFWLDLVSPFLMSRLEELGAGFSLRIDEEGLAQLADLFAALIDEKSHFTYRHSRRVARVARELGRALGLGPSQIAALNVAALLHDLGKLSVPAELLEKPEGLSWEEMNLFRQHPYYTYRILREVKRFNPIPAWAAYHHERLDGSGYPFRLTAKQLSPGARLVAVSDVFTALNEDRPYRPRLDRLRVERVLREEVQRRTLDAKMVSVLWDLGPSLWDHLAEPKPYPEA